MSLVAPPAGAVYQADAYNVDGANNVHRSHGDQVRTWYDGGSGSPAVLTTQSVYERPHMKMGGSEASVRFDGVDDRLTIPNSANRFAFIHTTGVFDLFFGFRVCGGGSRMLFGAAATNTQKGLAIVITADGQLIITIGNGSSSIAFSNQGFELAVPIGVPSILMVRGDGSNLLVSSNLWDFETAAFTGSLGSGDAVGDYTLGATSPAAASGTANQFLQGDLFFSSLYASNLSAGNLAGMASALQSRGIA